MVGSVEGVVPGARAALSMIEERYSSKVLPKLIHKDPFVEIEGGEVFIASRKAKKVSVLFMDKE